MKTVLRGILSTLVFLALCISALAQASATLSQAEAVRQYPELGKAGSKFNKAFVTKLSAAKAAQDPTLSRDDWPMILAKAVANELGVKPGGDSSNGKQTSTEGLPWPIEGHAFTLTELNQYREQIAGQIVWVKLWPTSIEAELVGNEYKIFVKDNIRDSDDKYAFVWFPIEGAKKMSLIGKTIGGGLSFYVKVEKNRLTAVARSRHIDSFRNTFTYTW